MLTQSLVLAAPMGQRVADAGFAQAQLAALFGPGVIVCAQNDDPASPPQPDCHDSCPLCRLAAEAAALDLPAPAVLSAPLLALGADLPLPLAERLFTPAPAPHPLPRGPPSTI